MKISMKRLGIMGVLGLAVACGRAEQQDSVGDETLANVEDAHLQTNEEAVSMSLSIAKESKTGLIVVERALSVGTGPGGRCHLHAGVHLLNVKTSGQSFKAIVSYPKNVKIKLSKNSCRANEGVLVEANSDFQGLAITANQIGTDFLREQKFGLPYCNPIQGRTIDLLGWSKIVKYSNACELDELEKSGFVKIPDDLICTQNFGTLISPKGEKVNFKNGCHQAALLRHGYRQSDQVAKSGSVAGISLTSHLMLSPEVDYKCFVYAGRQNIRITAPQKIDGFWGEVLAASPASGKNSSTAHSATLPPLPPQFFDECENGARLLVDGQRLESALTEAIRQPMPDATPKPLTDPLKPEICKI